MTQEALRHAKRWLAGGVLAATVLGAAGLSLANADGPPRLKPARSAAAAPLPRRAAVRPAAAAPAPAIQAEAMPIRRIIDTGGPIRYGDWFWQEDGAPATGRTVVTIDLAASTLSVFRDGFEIGTTAIIRGVDGHPTPLGRFPIRQKDADHRSRTYGGAPMPYMLRLTDDGVSIHGSDQIRFDAGTHGCIGIPVGFAKRLFEVTRVGDQVIVTRGKVVSEGATLTT